MNTRAAWLRCPQCGYETVEQDTCPYCREPQITGYARFGPQRLWAILRRGNDLVFYGPSHFGAQPKKKDEKSWQVMK